jgi:tRNA dimethylallyltransferase
MPGRGAAMAEWLAAMREAGIGHVLCLNGAAEIAQNTWGLVRKQRTWFRTQLPTEKVRVLASGDANVETLFNDGPSR